MKKKSSKKAKSLKKGSKPSVKKRSASGVKKGKKSSSTKKGSSSVKTKKKSATVKKSSKKVGAAKFLSDKPLKRKGKSKSQVKKKNLSEVERKNLSKVEKKGKTSTVNRGSTVSVGKRKKENSTAVIKGKKAVIEKRASGSQKRNGFLQKKPISGEEKSSPFSGSLNKPQPAEFPDRSKIRSKISSLRGSGRKVSRVEEITVRWLKEELQKIEEQKKKRNLIVKDMEGRDYCLFEDCDFPAVSGEYCRLHYIGRWDYIRIREEILGTGYIEKEINEILKNHSPLFIMYFIKDFRAEKNFLSSMKTFLDDEDSWEEEESLFMKEVTKTPKPEEIKEKKE